MRRLLPLIFLSGCQIQDPSGVPLLCDAANPCPPGRDCVGGMCADNADISVPSVTDLSDVDANQSDLGGTDLAEPPGCQSGGTRLAPKEWACPGVFGITKKASSLCAVGFAPCLKLSAAALAVCNSRSGFFASQLFGSRRDTDPVGTSRCDQAELVKTILGCGVGGTTSSMSCSGMNRLADCSAAVTTWTCGANLDASGNNNAANGVLCCG
jgi:hypothetical protein